MASRSFLIPIIGSLIIGVIITFSFLQFGGFPVESNHLYENKSTIIPGKWIFTSSKLFISNDTVNIFPGETANISIDLKMGEEGPWNVSFSYSQVEAIYSSTPICISNGLGYSIIPDNLTALPGDSYRISLKIISSKTVQSGQYFLLVTQSFNGGYENFWITVIVKENESDIIADSYNLDDPENVLTKIRSE